MLHDRSRTEWGHKNQSRRQSSPLSCDRSRLASSCLCGPIARLVRGSRRAQPGRKEKKGVFIMISKPLNLRRFGTGSSSSLMSIAEALSRDSMLPRSEQILMDAASTLQTTISSVKTCTSLNKDDRALDMRTIPVRSPRPPRTTPRNKKTGSVLGVTTSNRKKLLDDPDYRRAIARLSLQLRDLRDASSTLLGSPPMLTFRSAPSDIRHTQPSSGMNFERKISGKRNRLHIDQPHLASKRSSADAKSLQSSRVRTLPFVRIIVDLQVIGEAQLLGRSPAANENAVQLP